MKTQYIRHFNKNCWFTVCFILFGSLYTANACSCIKKHTSLIKQTKYNYNNSVIVFSGKVIDKKVFPKSEKYNSSMDPVVVTFEVDQFYKGNYYKKTIALITTADGASCGYHFEIGNSYMVYSNEYETYIPATKNTHKYRTGLCSGNKLRKNIKQKELKRLKRFRKKQKLQA